MHVVEQDYLEGSEACFPGCYSASCDWSKSMCSAVRESVASCQIFDAVALESLDSAVELSFVLGGSCRQNLTIIL